LGRDGLKLADTGLNMPIAVFYVISFLSIFWSTHPDISVSAFWRKLTEYILLFFIVAETVNDERIVRNIIAAMALSVFIVCADGIYQNITGHDLIRGYPLHSLERITGPFRFPNGLSAWLLVVSFPLIILSFFYKENTALKAANYALLVLIAYCAFYGFTRAAFLSFILGLGVMLILIGGRRPLIALTALFIIAPILILILPENVRNHVYVLKLFSGSSTQHRLHVWTAGWRMFMEKPFLGQGLNTFMANYARFRLPEDSGIWYAHNSYLQIAAEIGIFGLISFLWMIAKAAAISLRSWKGINDDFLRLIHIGLFCGIISFLIQSFFDVTHFSLQSAVLFYFSLGLLSAVRNIGLKI
jgi:putative inorganic carbon (HCO3(-)) transporter